jgi:hypothetical protein
VGSSILPQATKNYMSKILILIFAILVASCSHNNPVILPESQSMKIEKNTNNIQPVSIRDCVCADVWMPVCGKNGKTYSNACFAKCAGINFHQGSCDQVIKD